MARLTDSKIKSTLKNFRIGDDGDHRDGDGVFLRIAKPRPTSPNKFGSTKWYMAYSKVVYSTGAGESKAIKKRRTLMLGDYPAVGCVEARARAGMVREALDSDQDPHAVLNFSDRAKPKPKAKSKAKTKPKPNAAPVEDKYAVPVPETSIIRTDSSFEHVTRLYHVKIRPTLSSAKYAKAWLTELQVYFDAFGAVPMDKLTVAQIAATLEPEWHRVPDTSKKTAQRLIAIYKFYYAMTGGAFGAMNLAELAVQVMPKMKQSKRHFNSMPYSELPAFYGRLREREAMSAKCLQWVILTATRSQEARGALWSEIDMEKKTWVIPAARYKTKIDHTVFLTDHHLEFLEPLRGVGGGDLIFPNSNGRMFSENVFRALFERMGYFEVGKDGRQKLTLTAHGFRSTFRMFAEELTLADTNIAELMLGHLVGGAVERAYRRGAVRKHKMVELMTIWTSYVTGIVTEAELNAQLDAL